MPEIQQNTSIKITPERFLNACSATELYELDQLLGRPVYQDKIKAIMDPEDRQAEYDFTRISQ